MTKYMNPSFSVTLGGKAYGDGWDAIFGPKDTVDPSFEKILDDLKRKTYTSDIRDQVEEFHTAFGLPVLDKPTLPSKERMQLRLRLIAEEFVELLEACDSGYRYNMENLRREVSAAVDGIDDYIIMGDAADALADLDYVIEGMRLEFGINGKPIADEVHRSNMSKLGADGKPVYREDGKVTKGPNYSPPDIEGELRKQGWEG